MANNKTTIKSIPLKSKLNLNKNQLVISSTFDLLNKQNSPIDGGVLTPMYSVNVNHPAVGKYDRNGNYYYLQNNTLYVQKGLPYDSTSTPITDVNPTVPTITKINRDVDDLAIYNGWLFGTKQTSGQGVEIYRLDINNGNYNYGTVVYTDGQLLKSRLAVRQGYLNLILVYYYNEMIYVRVVKFDVNFGVVFDQNTIANFIKWVDDDEFKEIPASNGTTPFIAVSADYDTGNYGITIFEKRPQGTNTKQIGKRNIVVDGGLLYKADCLFCFWWNHEDDIRVHYLDSGKERKESTFNYRNFADCSNSDRDFAAQGVFVDNSRWIVHLMPDSSTTPGWSDDGATFYMAACPSRLSRYKEQNKFYGEENGMTYACPVVYKDGSGGEHQLDFADETGANSCTANQYYFRLYGVNMNNGNKYAGKSPYLDVYQWDIGDGKLRHFAGAQCSTAWDISSWDKARSSIFSASNTGGKNEMYSTNGSRVQIGNFRILFNYRGGNVSGISYNGILLTEWDSIDDSCTIVTDGGARAYYRDIKGNLCILNLYGKSMSINDVQIIDDRYILIPKCTKNNIYDTVTGKFETFGSDWNNRILPGVELMKYQWDKYMAHSYGRLFDTYSFKIGNGTFGSGKGIAYQTEKTFAPGRFWPYVTVSHAILDNPTVLDPPEDIDYFASNNSTSSPEYRCTYTSTGTSYSKGSLNGTALPSTATGSAYNNMPIVGVEFINNYNGKFGVKIADNGYNMLYDGIRPVAVYNQTSIVSDISDYFIIQSQYYAVINNYICALSYSSNNAINGVDSIVDITGMQFIGSFPSVAYFFSSLSKAIYAFTGDADLQLFVQSDKITQIYSWAYLPSPEWIVLNTNDGTYVLTQLNTFKIEGLSSSYKPAQKNNFMILRDSATSSKFMAIGGGTLVAETSYFGVGNNVESIIDCWYLTLFRKYNSKGYVKYYTKTASDMTVKSPEETIKIEESMFDENGIYVARLQPKYIKGKGTSLHFETDLCLADLGCSITEAETLVTEIKDPIRDSTVLAKNPQVVVNI